MWNLSTYEKEGRAREVMVVRRRRHSQGGPPGGAVPAGLSPAEQRDAASLTSHTCLLAPFLVLFHLQISLLLSDQGGAVGACGGRVHTHTHTHTHTVGTDGRPSETTPAWITSHQSSLPNAAKGCPPREPRWTRWVDARQMMTTRTSDTRDTNRLTRHTASRLPHTLSWRYR